MIRRKFLNIGNAGGSLRILFVKGDKRARTATNPMLSLLYRVTAVNI
jgi:hypothetical protein